MNKWKKEMPKAHRIVLIMKKKAKENVKEMQQNLNC